MQHGTALAVDYGPDFLGYASKVANKKIMCVVPSQATAHSAAAMRELVAGLGGDCDTCRCCPMRSIAA